MVGLSDIESRAKKWIRKEENWRDQAATLVMEKEARPTVETFLKELKSIRKSFMDRPPLSIINDTGALYAKQKIENLAKCIAATADHMQREQK